MDDLCFEADTLFEDQVEPDILSPLKKKNS